MPWMTGAAVLGGSAISGLLGSSAAQQQIDAMRSAIDYQKQKDQQTRTDLAPYRQFGGEQLNSLSGWLNDPSNNPASHLDPGYQFRLDQGNKGITANAGTAGLLKSGDTLRGLTQYGQDASSQEYNNAFNRYLQEGQFKQGLADMGQTAAMGTGQLANQGAANVGNLTANTNFGGPNQVWADVAGGLAGGASNMLARRMGAQAPPSSIPGGSNIFAPQANQLGLNAPQYNFAPSPYAP